MFRYAIFLFWLLLAVACGTSKNIGNNSSTSTVSAQEIAGRWQEQWDVGKVSDVNSDIYRLQVKNEQITLLCVNRKYEFEGIKFENNTLSFKLINKNQYEVKAGETPTEVYVIDYVLQYNKAKNSLEGQAQTNKGEKAKILWTRVL